MTDAHQYSNLQLETFCPGPFFQTRDHGEYFDRIALPCGFLNACKDFSEVPFAKLAQQCVLLRECAGLTIFRIPEYKTSCILDSDLVLLQKLPPLVATDYGLVDKSAVTG